MIKCKRCKKRKFCTRICEDVNNLLINGNHSLKSNYLVKFFDHQIMEEIFGSCNEFKDEYYSQKRLNYSKSLRWYIGRLPRIQKECLILYYGIRNNIMLRQDEIAKILHISQWYVSYSLKKAKINLKAMVSKGNKIFKFYNIMKDDSNE